MPLPTNPYTAGDPVGKTPYFVGREDVLREVERVLRAPNQNAITLHGQRRIGKTSVLQYLEAHLPELGNYQPVYFDLMNQTGMTLDEIVVNLARTIALRLKLPDPALGEDPTGKFQTEFLPACLATLPTDASLVLLLDEFDVLADPQAEQQIKTRFFSYLGDLRQLDHQRLQFIFVLGRNVDDLDVVARGLFKDLPAFRVSLFAEKDAEALVRLSERNKSLSWGAEAVNAVWQMVSGHPYLTQALCYQIWEDAYEQGNESEPVTANDVENAIPAAMQRSQNMFTWLWEGLEPAEKVAAAALAGAGQTIVDEDLLSHILSESGVRILIGELRDAPRKLKDWDILTPADGGYVFRVEILRRWIAENKPLSRTWEELDRINPVADNLYNIARSFYQANNLSEAISDLRRALNNNPNHQGAQELLAEILLTTGEIDEAQTILEQLLGSAPSKARHRLKQVYLNRTDAESQPDEKLIWLEKAQNLTPEDNYVQSRIRDLRIKNALKEIDILKQKRSYQKVHQHILNFMEVYPGEHDWQTELNWLEQAGLLDDKYKKALGLLEQGDRVTAKRLLAEVIAIDPDYEQASLYLHLAVTCDDPLALKQELADAKSKPALDVKNTQDISEPRTLSKWNPLDALRLLWWIGATPAVLNDYKKKHGATSTQTIGSRLCFMLTFLPLLMPTMGISLGLFGNAFTGLDTTLIRGAGGLLLLIWLLVWLMADVLENNGGDVFFGSAVAFGAVALGVAIVLSGVVAVGVAFGMAGGVAGILAVGVSVGVSVGVAVGMAFVLTSGLAVFVSLGVAVGVALGVAAGIGFSVHSGVADGETFVLASIVAVCTTGCVALSMASCVKNNIKRRIPNLWLLVLIAISWFTLAFFSAGGLVWLQSVDLGFPPGFFEEL